jgi:hypothetical protein
VTILPVVKEPCGPPRAINTPSGEPARRLKGKFHLSTDSFNRQENVGQEKQQQKTG